MTYVKSIDNDVTHRKIFTLSKLLVIFYTLEYDKLYPSGPARIYGTPKMHKFSSSD